MRTMAGILTLAALAGCAGGGGPPPSAICDSLGMTLPTVSERDTMQTIIEVDQLIRTYEAACKVK